jgi:uncharacterized protein (DUF433 family)
MDRRKLVMTGVVSASVGAGMLLGAVVFTPGVGFAADSMADGDLAMVCERVLGDGPIAAAADAIGIEPSALIAELRDGSTIAEVAETHGVDPSVVVDAIVADEGERLDQAVEDGVLTREQADAQLSELKSRATDLVNGDLPMPDDRMPLMGRPGLWGFADGPIAAAADVIGIRPVRLLAELRDGSTIADVAEAHGVDPSDVVDAVVASLQERLDAAVDNGWISQEQADERSAELQEQADALVNGDLAPLPFPGLRGGPGGGMFGPEMGVSSSTAESSRF